MIRRFASAVACGFGLLLAAAPVSGAGSEIVVSPLPHGSPEQKLATSIAEWLYIGGGAQNAIRLDGPIAASRQGDRITVTLPGVRFGHAGSTFLLGDVVLDAVPAGPHAFDFALRPLPGIRIVEDGEETARIAFGQQQVEGRWNTEILTATAIEARWEDVRATPTGAGAANASLTIAAARLTGGVSEARPDAWSGSYTLRAEDIAVAGRQQGERATIGWVEIDSAADGIDLRRHVRAIRDGMTNLRSGADSGEEIEASLGLLHELLSRSFGTGGTSRSSFAIAEVGVWNGPRKIVGFDKLGFAIGAELRPGGLAMVDLGIEASEIAIDGGGQLSVPSQFVPRNLKIAVAVDRLPLRGLLEVLMEQARNDPRDSRDEGSVSPPGPDPRLMALLLQARPVIALNDILFDAPALQLTGDGKVATDAESVSMASGRFSFTVERLDKALAAAQRAIAEGNEEVRDVLPVLILLQGMGKPVVAGDGKGIAYLYEIAMPKDGNITINGIALDALGG